MNEITDYSQKASWYIQGKKRTMKKTMLWVLAAKCVNGTFVGKKADGLIAYKGIPFVGKQPVGELRWKAPVDVTPSDSVYEAYYHGKSPRHIHPEKESERKILDWERTYFLTKYYCI